MANVEIKIIGHNDNPTIWYNTLVGEVLTVEYPFQYDEDQKDRIKLRVGSLPSDILSKASFTYSIPDVNTPIYIFLEDFFVLTKSELETILDQLNKEVGTTH